MKVRNITKANVMETAYNIYGISDFIKKINSLSSDKERYLFLKLASRILENGGKLHKGACRQYLGQHHLSKNWIKFLLKRWVSLGLLARTGRYNHYYSLTLAPRDFHLLEPAIRFAVKFGYLDA